MSPRSENQLNFSFNVSEEEDEFKPMGPRAWFENNPHDSFVTSIGISGNGYGELHRPSSVAVDHEGFVYVADWGNDRIQVFDKYGNFVAATLGESTLSPWAQEYFNANVEEKKLSC